MASGGPLHGPPNLCLKFEGARQASSPSLCASVRAVPWADEAEHQLSRLAISTCGLSADVVIFQSRAAGGVRHVSHKIRLKFEGARQASSPSLCASVREVPWADESEHQLSRLVLSGGELSADVRIFWAGLPEALVMHRPPKIRLKFEGAGQASSPSLCASV